MLFVFLFNHTVTIYELSALVHWHFGLENTLKMRNVFFAISLALYSVDLFSSVI